VTFKALTERRFHMARSNKQPLRKVRVREIPLDRIDEGKLALAFWLMAKRMAEEDATAGREDQAP
jgi:hypothetical protein